ncbi:uncharacterized protein [Temnothorax longispinosus]|uniref:uncharacterized protein n=1 Tax=Temnothorax longispinosus TaxID=300112 RepID=UPI003A99CB55
MYKCVPTSVCNSFFERQSGPLSSFFRSHFYRINKKFEFFVSKSIDRSANIGTIKYYCNFPTEHSNPPEGGDFQFSFKPTHRLYNDKRTEIEIKVSPESFVDTQSTFMQINDKWFVNLSSTVIPKDIQCLLQLGNNFSLPVTNKNSVMIEFIKSIENNLKKHSLTHQIAIRNRLINIINNLPNYYSVPKNIFNTKIQKLVSDTKIFLNDNPNLILTRADKGNVTVALDKNKYINEIESLLGDRETYQVINVDPTNKLTAYARKILTKWKKSNFISNSTYRRVYCSDGVLPRAYGLPKIHKANCPFRLIISSLNSPLYDLAAFLHRIMIENFPTAKSHIKNSFELVQRLANTRIEDGYKLISLDVVSLFTIYNVSVEMVLDSISARWNYIAAKCKIPKPEFLTTVKLVLNSTFFTFNGRIYQQTFGTPMGSPLSPIGADIVMQDLENKALTILRYTPSFFNRYVDDIALAAPSALLQHTLDVFNSFHPRLQFTMEVGEGDTLNFLEVTMILKHNRLTFDWFHKPTFSGRYLNFMSQHPTCQKRGTVIGLIDRVFRLSHPSFHAKNFGLVIEILLNNGYPLDFVFRVLHERLKLLVNYRKDGGNDNMTEKEITPFFTIPYVPKITEQFSNISRRVIARQSLSRMVLSFTGLPSSKRLLLLFLQCSLCRRAMVNKLWCLEIGRRWRQAARQEPPQTRVLSEPKCQSYVAIWYLYYRWTIFLARRTNV